MEVNFFRILCQGKTKQYFGIAKKILKKIKGVIKCRVEKEHMVKRGVDLKRVSLKRNSGKVL